MTVILFFDDVKTYNLSFIFDSISVIFKTSRSLNHSMIFRICALFSLKKAIFHTFMILKFRSSNGFFYKASYIISAYATEASRGA